MTSPTVAVVMCTYNGEKYLRQQLDSILAQTYPIQERLYKMTARPMQPWPSYKNMRPKFLSYKSLRIHIIWDSILTSRPPVCGPQPT